MAKKSSFIDRIRPLRERTRLIDWPFPVEGEVPKVRIKVLTQDEMEDAYFAAIEHFKDLRPGLKPRPSDAPVAAREKTELTWRAFEDPETGEPITASADELAAQGPEFILPLYDAWASFQGELTERPLTQSAMDELVDHLKKNTRTDHLRALPSSWLIALITTLVSQLRDSTSSSKPG